ncbi:MAG: hypothetical protein KDA21_13495, partial [Phycisphaerales bacterium]|nr:hypothetical protein [Phycisphaerales bacterium]
LTAFSAQLFDSTFIDVSNSFPKNMSPGQFMLDYIPGLNLLDILSLVGLPVPGEWTSIDIPPKGLFIADFRTPQLYAQGCFDPATNSFHTSADDRFFKFGISVTEAILRIFGLTAQFEFEFPESPGDGGSGGGGGGEEEDESDFAISGFGQVLQLIARTDVAVEQEIDVGVTPRVHYRFSDGIPDQVLDLGEDIIFTFPNDGTVEIYPTLMTSARFSNMTGIRFYPGIEWKTLDFGIALAAFGFELLSFGDCLLCFDWDLSEILTAICDLVDPCPFDPNAVNLAIPVFGGLPGTFDDPWDIPFDAQPLPCIRILGSSKTQPRLVGASRGFLSMIIYDQTSPSVGSFNVAIDGSKKMLLYGERLLSNSVVHLEHHGRIEDLPTTWINDSTLLTEIPNHFRLLPGVAKLWVTTSLGTSESIDMPIEYPTPRLDAVNPNLWAADPDLATIPVSVIDAKSLAGNDTFIARRDYWILMRDQLWTEVVSSTPIDAYFPMFDFNQLPAFPAVLWGVGSAGVMPLPRYAQPVDNGIHNVRLAESNYDRARLVPVALCNPCPGGGMSNPIDLTIAAPVPVIASVEPDGMSPLDVVMDDNYFDPDDLPVARPVELVVRGPHHVPTFHGYEEPKYGNFNASSVVRFDGMDLPTTFTSSALLTAELPAGMALEGTHYVTVFTPANGTVYFEELRNGDGDIVFQGYMPSGGESAPYLFTVAYRPPTISAVSPDVVPLNAPGFDDSQWMSAPASNFTIMGSDFREGAVVRVDGNLRVTTYVNSHMLQVKLLPEDAAVPGDHVVVVTNPGIGSPQAETVLRVSQTPLSPARAPAHRRRGPGNAAGASMQAAPR